MGMGLERGEFGFDLRQQVSNRRLVLLPGEIALAFANDP
jgi:hypothetical protein